jgi:hydroxymethylbilane synthase
MRIGTRGSALALTQAEQVARLLGGAELITIRTRGDAGAGADALSPDGDKSRWVAELEQALLDEEIDLAVHSAKDVPGELAEGLALLAAPKRASAEDVLCGASALEELAPGARVGTSSIRRLAQLRAAREDLEVVPIRGNVDTRLRKLAAPASRDAGERLDAIVLALAGLQRLGRESEAGATLAVERFVPAPGQGVLALEGRAEDDRVRAAVRAINDDAALACLLAERALARELGASCHTPLGAYATPSNGGGLHLRAWIGLPDGSEWISDELGGDRRDPEELGRLVAARLRAVGAGVLLEQAENSVC